MKKEKQREKNIKHYGDDNRADIIIREMALRWEIIIKHKYIFEWAMQGCNEYKRLWFNIIQIQDVQNVGMYTWMEYPI